MSVSSMGNLMSSVLLSLQLPMPSSQLSSSFAASTWLCLMVKASVLTVYTSIPLSVNSL